MYKIRSGIVFGRAWAAPASHVWVTGFLDLRLFRVCFVMLPKSTCQTNSMFPLVIPTVWVNVPSLRIIANLLAHFPDAPDLAEVPMHVQLGFVYYFGFCDCIT